MSPSGVFSDFVFLILVVSFHAKKGERKILNWRDNISNVVWDLQRSSTSSNSSLTRRAATQTSNYRILNQQTKHDVIQLFPINVDLLA